MSSSNPAKPAKRDGKVVNTGTSAPASQPAAPSAAASGAAALAGPRTVPPSPHRIASAALYAGAAARRSARDNAGKPAPLLADEQAAAMEEPAAAASAAGDNGECA
jgi:hypothetical protein